MTSDKVKAIAYEILVKSADIYSTDMVDGVKLMTNAVIEALDEEQRQQLHEEDEMIRRIKTTPCTIMAREDESKAPAKSEKKMSPQSKGGKASKNIDNNELLEKRKSGMTIEKLAAEYGVCPQTICNRLNKVSEKKETEELKGK